MQPDFLVTMYYIHLATHLVLLCKPAADSAQVRKRIEDLFLGETAIIEDLVNILRITVISANHMCNNVSHTLFRRKYATFK